MEDKKKYITAEELKRHNKPDDLWMSIHGKVYNVTDWIKDHPGGDIPLLNLAGQDVTDAFIAFHPGSAWKYLDKFFTGYYLKDFQVSEVSKDYRRLANQFTAAGLFEKKGHGVIYSLSFITLMLAMCVYGVLCCDNFWIHMLSGALLGLSWVQVTFLGHDSGHYQIMSTRGFNKFAQILTGNCLTGISIAWWKWTHNAHHIACNSLDHDPDLQHLPVFAVSSKFFQSLTSSFYGRKLIFDSMARLFVSYQHFSYYPVMIVARVNLYLQTLLLLLSKRKVPDRAFNILGILVFWTWFPLLVSCLPNWNERVLFVLTSFFRHRFSTYSIHLEPFCSQCLRWPSCGERLVRKTDRWHNRHHMLFLDGLGIWWIAIPARASPFPQVAKVSSEENFPIVQELCKKHNLPYRSYSFYEANLTTLKTLRTAALQARDLANPAPKNLLWEAVNTHG